MRLHSLVLQNMRLFGSPARRIEFAEDKNITIFLGNNGTGKTTILDSIMSMLSPFMAEFPGPSIIQFKESDVHKIERLRTSGYLSVEIDLETENGQIEKVIRSRKATVEPEKATDVKALRDYAKSIMSKIAHDEPVELPIIAYYGVGRGFVKSPERKRNFTDVFERWESYVGASQPNTDFKRFFNWFDLQEDEERRERESRRDWDYRSPGLELVRTALTTFVGHRCTNPRIKTSPLRFVFDETSADGSTKELRLEEMSDGYKIVIAMVADIAARMIEANPISENNPNPLDASGIVLIDEIDLHLHPKWQREILRQLHATFPHVQFIVTTHSPVIVLGIADECQIVRLEGGDVFPTQASSISTHDMNHLLLSQLFGLDSVFSTEWDQVFSERESLLKKNTLTDAERARLAELDKEISRLDIGSTTDSISDRKRLIELLEKYCV